MDSSAALPLAHPRCTAGVRPSSGAASSDLPGTLENLKEPLSPDVAAPEDGRTPDLMCACA
jgi:hypothetical protein